MILTLLIIGGVAATGITTFFIGRRIGRNKYPEIRKELKEFKKDKQKNKGRIEYLEQRLKNYEKKIDHLNSAKDTYKEIASTHDIKVPNVPEPEFVMNEKWEDRLFKGTMEMNLEHLAEDLNVFDGKDIRIQIELESLGGWKSIVKSNWRTNGRPTSTLSKNTLTFQGTPKRIIQQVRAWFLDDDHGFVTNHKTKKWKDEDSILIWEVDLSVVELEEFHLPEVHTVEIAVPEIQIKEVIVNKPVHIGVGETFLLESDVIALANAVVDVREGKEIVPALEQLQEEEMFDPPLLEPDMEIEE